MILESSCLGKDVYCFSVADAVMSPLAIQLWLETFEVAETQGWSPRSPARPRGLG